MILTEEEAKTKWCPFARELYSDDRDGTAVFAAANRFNRHPEKMSRCIASQCMAWRWEVGPIGTRKTATGQNTNVIKDQCGFCGLVGKIEL